MRTQYQDAGAKQTILEHGQSVRSHFLQLLLDLKNATLSAYPPWMQDYASHLEPILLAHQERIETYLLYHDCAKPYCIQWDEQGRAHFPNHAQLSSTLFLQYHSDPLIGTLIAHDMCCHVSKPADAPALAQMPYIEILLCAAACETLSNAKMFGGTQSTSFKIKFKNLSKLGQRILMQKYGTPSGTACKQEHL